MKKKIFITLFALAIISVVYGINYMGTAETSVPHGDKYCAKLKDGKVTMMYQGNVMTTNVTLENGTIVQSDGTVITKDGTRTTLKQGECIDTKGNIMQKKKDKLKNEEDDDDENEHHHEEKKND